MSEEGRELLVIADRWAKRYGRLPRDLFRDGDVAGIALDLAAMGVGDEVRFALAKRVGAFPVVEME